MSKTTDFLELDVPEAVLDADRAIEIVRASIADDALHVVLEAGVFGDDLSEWGRVLAGIAVHAARAGALNGIMPEQDAVAAIERAFISALPQAVKLSTGHAAGRAQH